MPSTTPPKHSVLIVDDEPEILFSLKGLLRRDFELFTAESGDQALEILSQHPIHIVMTDQRMPEMTGAELMGRIKSEYPDAIRMIFTGYADIQAVIEAINKGGLFRYITKPWDPDELIELLRDAATEYESIVQRRQLCAELCDQLELGQRYAKRLVSQDPEIDANEINRYIQNTTSLITQIEQQRLEPTPAVHR